MKEMRSFNNKNQNPKMRVIGGVWVYIVLSQESSRCAKI
jgi:hypothetical protein